MAQILRGSPELCEQEVPSQPASPDATSLAGRLALCCFRFSAGC
ncbi:MAG: hypothetical protein ACK57G_09885 [Planctomycetota bacterium]